MNEASEYEERIAKALLRIATAVEKERSLPPPAVVDSEESQDDDAPALSAALEEERASRVRLQGELDRLQSSHEARESALASERDTARERLSAMDEAMQSLRAAQANLGQIVAELREALAGQVAEPELVNRAMQAEIDLLTAQRRSDVAEIDAVLGELAPLVSEEDQNARG